MNHSKARTEQICPTCSFLEKEEIVELLVSFVPEMRTEVNFDNLSETFTQLRSLELGAETRNIKR